MTFASVMRKFMGKDDQYSEMEANMKREKKLIQRQKNSNERELERFQEEERQRQIKVELEGFRQRKKEEFWHGQSILDQKNIFKGHTSVLTDNKNLFKPSPMHGQRMFFK